MERKREREKKTVKRRRNIIILLLTHRESGEGNSNDASFLLFLNRDNITFPSCLGGREINMIPPKCNKVSPLTYGEEKSDVLQKFHVCLISLTCLVLRVGNLKNLIRSVCK